MNLNPGSAVRALVMACSLGMAPYARAEDLGLTLEQYLSRVLVYNENIQIKILEAEISRRQFEGQKGIFEPVLVNSFVGEDKHNALTVEQQRNLFFATVFNERNNRYESAVEMLAPTGAKVRMGYNLNALRNNLNAATYPNGEYSSTVGVSITQPLLKDGGYAATMANIRAAAINSEISFQEYRKALIEVVSRAEAAYWDIYLAQQQYAFSQDSVKVADTLLQDIQGKLAVGKSSELDVLQAEAGLAERQALENEARQKLYEAVNRAMIFYSGSALGTQERIRAVDEPKPRPVAAESINYRTVAETLNPDSLSLKQQFILDDLRIGYAKNQRMPQLDLKGTFGSSRIDDDPTGPWRNMAPIDFPAWSVGVELRLPMGGNLKARYDLDAARLRKKNTELSIQTLNVQLDNVIDSALKTSQAYYDNIQRYHKVVDFNENLLKTQLARLDVGKIDSRTALETERDLFEARLAWVQSTIRFKRAVLDLEQAVGMTLKERNLEITRADLTRRTRVILQDGRVTTRAFEQFLENMRKEYELRQLQQQQMSAIAPAAAPAPSAPATSAAP